MGFDEFFAEIYRKGISLSFECHEGTRPALLSNEALFHLPFLAMTILILSGGRSKPKTSEIGQTVGECLELSIIGFKGSSQHLGWSANLRMRTVRALSFLEVSCMVEIDKSNSRIMATDVGRKVIMSALSNDTDLSYNLKVIERSYRNMNNERKIQQEFI